MSDQLIEDPEVNLRDPWLAAGLAFLVPGLGHLYQRRFFKAAVYAVCIIGLWFSGMHIGRWQISQAPVDRPGIPRSRMLSFLAQCGVGLPGLYAYYQARRYNNGDAQAVTALDREFSAEFSGQIRLRDGDRDLDEDVTGTLALAPAQGRFGDPTIVGRLDGTTESGEPLNVWLDQGVKLGPVLRASKDRHVSGDVVEGTGEDARIVGVLAGTIPRSFPNRFLAPLDEDEEQQLHRELGKMHELALVFTWIAGLLNLLAVWDALEGPAYGYGLVDETEEDESQPPAAESHVPEEVKSEKKVAAEVARKAG